MDRAVAIDTKRWRLIASRLESPLQADLSRSQVRSWPAARAKSGHSVRGAWPTASPS